MVGRSEGALCQKVGVLVGGFPPIARGHSGCPPLNVKERKSGFPVWILMLSLLRKLGDSGLATDLCGRMVGTGRSARGTVPSH